MTHSRFLSASVLLLACLLSCISCTAIQAETQYRESYDDFEPSPYSDYRPSPYMTGDDADDFDDLDDTYWYVPEVYLKAYLYLNGIQVPVLDQTVWHLQTARTRRPDGYIFGRSTASFFPANPPPGFQPSYGCNRMLGSITPSRSVYISFIPTTNANGSAVTTGLGSFGRFRQGWAFEMQMGSGNPSVLASHWAYMVPCEPHQPCWSSLPGVGMSIPEFMSKCNFTV